MERAFRVNTPAVASEVIDGEAVIMNLQSGMYFSTRGIGGLVWTWLERGLSDVTIAAAVAQAHGAPVDQVTQAIAGFIAELEAQDLIRPRSAAANPLGQFDDLAQVGPFVPPVLEVFNDMQDLLLLDPIHDVDEQVGWPSPKPQEGTAP